MKALLYTPVAIFGIFLLLFLVEKLFPLRESRSGLLARLIVNGCLSLLTFAVAATVVRPAALGALDWSATRTFGLVHVVPLPGWAQFVVGFLLLDLSFYYWHLLNHKVPLLWRFHNVHHYDPALDVSTGFRFHFVEVLLSTVFRVVQVSVSGVSFFTFAVYEVVFQANTLFQHSNLRLPVGLECWLNRIIVTPRMHGIHHSQVRRETDSNYGVVFPWWDRMHRTLGLNVPQSDIVIGVPGYTAPADNTVWRVIVTPFLKQRDYWRRPDGSVPERCADQTGPSKTTLVE